MEGLRFMRFENFLTISDEEPGFKITIRNQYAPSFRIEYLHTKTGVFHIAPDGSGTAADEVFAGTIWNDSIVAGAGNDYEFGDDGIDTIAGGSGDDTITGGRGVDSPLGQDGNDVFIIYPGDYVDHIDGGRDAERGVLSVRRYAGWARWRRSYRWWPRR